jgi:ABC-type amino acid transport substrate-binding protein
LNLKCLNSIGYSLFRSVNKLFKGRVDLFIENRDVGLYYPNKHGVIDKIVYSDKLVEDPKPHYITFSMKPGNKEIVAKFDTTLKSYKKTQKYNDILNKYGQ